LVPVTALSPLLRDLPEDKRVVRGFDGDDELYVTLDLYDAMLDEFRQRWVRDQKFARRVCRERGFDIDALAKGAPEYAEPDS
jgi:hypothetical protein